MNFLMIAVIAAIITFAALMVRNFVLAISASGMWIFTAYYVLNNPPFGLTAGDTGHQILLIVLAGVILGVPMYVVLGNGTATSGESRGNVTRVIVENRNFSWRRFLSSGDIGNREIPPPHEETQEEYRARVNRALHPNRIQGLRKGR